MSSAKVFISYTHSDSSWVRQFAEALKRHGIIVWFDTWVIKIGDDIRESIEKGLRESDVIVVVVSKESQKSTNLFFEMGAAVGMGKEVIPIVESHIDQSSMPYTLRTRVMVKKGSPAVTADLIKERISQDNNK